MTEQHQPAADQPREPAASDANTQPQWPVPPAPPASPWPAPPAPPAPTQQWPAAQPAQQPAQQPTQQWPAYAAQHPYDAPAGPYGYPAAPAAPAPRSRGAFWRSTAVRCVATAAAALLIAGTSFALGTTQSHTRVVQVPSASAGG